MSDPSPPPLRPPDREPPAARPDARAARIRAALLADAVATERRCHRAERVVLTAVALALLVTFCLRDACLACGRSRPAPAVVEPGYGWPI